MKEKKSGLFGVERSLASKLEEAGKSVGAKEDSGNGAIFQEAAGEWAREGPLQEAAFGVLELRCCCVFTDHRPLFLIIGLHGAFFFFTAAFLTSTGKHSNVFEMLSIL